MIKGEWVEKTIELTELIPYMDDRPLTDEVLKELEIIEFNPPHKKYPTLDFSDLKNAFQNFANNIPFYGFVLVNVDDLNISEISKGIKGWRRKFN